MCCFFPFLFYFTLLLCVQINIIRFIFARSFVKNTTFRIIIIINSEIIFLTSVLCTIIFLFHAFFPCCLRKKILVLQVVVSGVGSVLEYFHFYSIHLLDDLSLLLAAPALTTFLGCLSFRCLFRFIPALTSHLHFYVFSKTKGSNSKNCVQCLSFF